MNLLALFRRQRAAPVARERLQFVPDDNAEAAKQSVSFDVLREEIAAAVLTTIKKHVPIDRDDIHVKLDRRAAVPTLEIDVEMRNLSVTGDGQFKPPFGEEDGTVPTRADQMAARIEAGFRRGAANAIQQAHDRGIAVPVLDDDQRIAWLAPDDGIKQSGTRR